MKISRDSIRWFFFGKKDNNPESNANIIDSDDDIQVSSNSSSSNHFINGLKEKAIQAKSNCSNNFLNMVQSNLPLYFVIDYTHSARFLGFLEDYNLDNSRFPIMSENDASGICLYCSPNAYKHLISLYISKYPDCPINLIEIHKSHPSHGEKIDTNKCNAYSDLFKIGLSPDNYDIEK